MYQGGPQTPCAQAQHYQADWLLDQIQCQRGTRLLDVGCGNGTLLETASQRGAAAIGITISQRQVQRCLRKGLDVRLCDYRQLDRSHNAAYDALVANGSIEHFVKAEQAAAGQSDTIYQQMFATFHRLLAPRSPTGRLATTPMRLLRQTWQAV
jgi:cyclopropane-fatty-acyl-phospholipid synthase